MAVREYIGARYIPKFADPIQWDPANTYESLEVVTNHGASYVSRREVPAGIQLDDNAYWVKWSDFNAQLQYYINMEDSFNGRVVALEDALPIADYDSANTVSDAIAAINNRFPIVTADIADDAVTAAKVDDGAIGTAALADDAVTAAKVDDGAIGTAALADNAVTFGKINFPLSDNFTDEYDIFVACTTGNDANDGHDDANAVKTLDKAFEIAEQHGARNVAIRIRENGTYSTDKKEFSGMVLHFTSGSVANNAIIEFNNLAGFYNCYLHFSTYSGYTFKFKFINGMHFDNCSLYASNVQFDISARADFFYCKASFEGVEIASSILISTFMSEMQFDTVKFSATSLHYWIYARCSMMRFVNGLEIETTQDFSSGWVFRFDESCVFFAPITPTITKKNTSSWVNFIQIQRTLAIAPGGLQSAVASAISGSFAGGNYSLIKAGSGITDIPNTI